MKPAEPAVVNHAPVAQIAGQSARLKPVLISLSAEGSTDPDGNTLTYTWRSQDGQTVPVRIKRLSPSRLQSLQRLSRLKSA
jgi:hypothetical protein